MQDATVPRDAPSDPARSDGVVAIRGAALLGGGYVVSILLALVSAPLLIRHLGNDYGVYVTITALVTVVFGMSELGLTAMAVREWVGGARTRRRELLADLLGARIAFTLTGIAGAMVFALLAGYGSRRLLGTGLACVGLFVMCMQSAFTVPLAARMRQGWIAAADLLRQAVQVALIVALVVSGAGLVPMLATTIPAALASLGLTLAASRDALVLPSLRPARWLALLRQTIPFAAATAASVLYLRLTIIISSLVATPHQNDEFAIAFRVIEILINVPGLLVSALFPLISRVAAEDPARLRGSVETMIRAAAGIGAVVAAASFTIAPLAILVLTGGRSAPVVEALRILSIGLGFTFLGATAQYALLALHAHRSILLVSIAALLLNGALTVLLAPGHGAPGAAAALAASEITVAGLSTLLLLRRIPGLRLPRGVVLPIVATLAVAALADLLLAPVSPVLAAVLVPLIIVLAGVLSRAIAREVLRAIPFVGHRL